MRFLYLGQMHQAGAMGGHLRLPMMVGKHLIEQGGGRVDVLPDFEALDVDWSGYDVVHGNGSFPCAWKAKRSGCKFVLTHPNSWTEEVVHGWRTGRGGIYRPGQAAVYAGRLARGALTLTMADAVAASRATARGMVQHAPWVKDKIYHMEYGTDADYFTPDGARDEGFILFVGRIERVKGVDTLLDALSGMEDRVVVAGSGSQLEAMRGLAGPNVEFLGEVSDEKLIELFRSASMCILPSRFEGFGLVALEALACGTPTAVTSGFGFRLVPPSADWVEWFPPEDPRALREAVERLRGRKTPEWSKAAHEMVAKHHHVRDQARNLIRLYEALAEGRPIPAGDPMHPSSSASL